MAARRRAICGAASETNTIGPAAAVTAAGLLTVRDLSRRWVVSEAAVLLLAKRVNLTSRKWGVT